VLQSWLAIQGTGSDQVSAVGVNVGSVFNDDGYSFETGRRGSYRADAEAGSYHFSGGIATVGVTDGANEFFGPDAESFVLSTIIDEADALFDSPAQGGGGDVFSTVHVAQQTGTVAATRTDGTFTGFAGGMVACPDCGSVTPYAMLSGSTTDVELRLEAASRTVGGHITVGVAEFGPDDLQDFTVGFGSEGTNSRSAYIDENIYAARDSNVSTQTNATILVSSTPTAVSQEPSYNAKTYVVSSDTVPTDGADFMNGASCSNCDFIEWGWWGTQADLTDGGSTTAQASVHLGTWVAGEVSTHDDIDAYHTIAQGTNDVTATYAGQAVGTVNNNGSQYVAGGSLDVTWDFGARSGSWDVTNYDNRDLSGAIGQNGPAQFIGETITVDGGAATGVVNGAFVSDGVNPAAGAIGDFAVQDGIWSTVGTFGGSQTGIAPN
jgi:hypothetical protein